MLVCVTENEFTDRVERTMTCWEVVERDFGACRAR